MDCCEGQSLFKRGPRQLAKQEALPSQERIKGGTLVLQQTRRWVAGYIPPYAGDALSPLQLCYAAVSLPVLAG